MTSLKEEQSSLITELSQAQQILILLLLTVPNPEQDRRVQEVSKSISTNTTRIAGIVRNYYKSSIKNKTYHPG